MTPRGASASIGVEIRLRNLPRNGEEFVRGDVPADGDWAESVRKAAAAIGWGDRRSRPDVDAGSRSRSKSRRNHRAPRIRSSGCTFGRQRHGLAGTSDMGQGARTVLAQIAAR